MPAVAALAFVVPAARADMAPPALADVTCPRGAVPEYPVVRAGATDDRGRPIRAWPYCAASVCTSNADCDGGRVCSTDEIGLCMESHEVPGGEPVRNARDRGCEPDGTCLNIASTCERARRCVAPSQEGEAPPQTGDGPESDEPSSPGDEAPRETESVPPASIPAASGCACRASSARRSPPLAYLALAVLAVAFGCRRAWRTRLTAGSRAVASLRPLVMLASVLVAVACGQRAQLTEPERGGQAAHADPVEPAQSPRPADEPEQAEPAAGWTVWQTVEGGDPSGDRVSVSTPAGRAQRWELSGPRTVERVHAPSGYTTGSSVSVVLSGPEPEAERTLRVHLPYGATLDLAAGERVEVRAQASPRGLGHRVHVQVMRGEDLILLSTEEADAAGVRVERGLEMPSSGSGRRYGVNVTVGDVRLELELDQLARVRTPPLLVSGGEVSYEDGVVPPDGAESPAE